MSGSIRLLVAAAEYPGHVLPELALASELRARGHEVLFMTSERWRESVERSGAELLAVEDVTGVIEHGRFDHRLAEAARALAGRLREFRPHLIVSDIATAAPPLAAELVGVPHVSLVPTVYPVQGRGLPPYPLGLRAPRTRLGAAMWRAVEPASAPVRGPTRWLRRVPRLLGRVREDLGLPPLAGGAGAITTYGPLSSRLVLVATFPQLEYPRPWPAHVHVTGPMIFEGEYPDVELPPGNDPLVLVSSSTAQDPERDLVRVAIDALGSEPVRVVATLNQRGARWTGGTGDNVRVVDWISYAQVMPRASAVLTSGGHGTVTRALADGLPVLVSPSFGDQPENGARVAWSGAGLMVPRGLLRPDALRWAARALLADPRYAERARGLAAWARAHDGAARAAELVERHARGTT